MVSFLWRKMWKNKWMMVCLLIGNLLLVGIVAATPLYINATMRRILHQDLRAFQAYYETHPAIMSLSFAFNDAAPARRMEFYYNTVNLFAPGIISDIGIPAVRTIRQNTAGSWSVLPYPPRTMNPRIINLVGIEYGLDYIEITQGRLPSNYLENGNIIEAVITEQTRTRNVILLNEKLEVRNVEHPAGQLYVHIVGIYRLPENSNEFWSISRLDHAANNFLISDSLMSEYFVENYHVDFRITATWFHLLDYRAMTSRHVNHYLAVIDAHRRGFTLDTSRQPWRYYENFSETIMQHTERAGRLAITLWVLQVPIYVMLAFYIYMVSRQILQLEQNEISVLKSRGASRFQILGLYAMQGFFVAAVCYPGGMALGVFICRMLGASNGFLELVQRTAIIVEITPDALLFAGLAMFLSFLTMFLPVIRFSKVGIVDHKRSRSGKLPLWQRFFLDIIALGVSIYALYMFNAQQETIVVVDEQAIDPILFLSSSLFIMGLGLLCLRLFPLVIRLVFKIGQRFWRPATYASLLKVIRSAGEEQFIMIFLLFTLSVGIFSAQAARTINLNSDHQIQYLSGADLTFQEFWQRQIPMPGVTTPVFFEPDINRFAVLDEVDFFTPVKRQYVDIQQTSLINEISDVELMAIETSSFGNTVWFRDDLLRTHINNFLNVLASQANGILLSDNFRTSIGIELGDTIRFSDQYNRSANGVVVGFVEHWPGFAPIQRVEIDENVVELPQSLIVANLGYLQTRWGVQPYQVWMSTNTETNRFFYYFVEENRLNLRYFSDAKADLVESRSNPILQGTNGVLTVGFIVTLVICFAGFLIYWILSIRSRVLQFGIFRAMGMSMRSLIGLLINEQFFITFTAILIGAFVGEVSAGLFVPLIQMSYSAAEQVIPLMIVTEIRDYMNLYSVIGVMIAVSLVILAGYISKIKIAQALKLGED